jgi:transmembrane sensor
MLDEHIDLFRKRMEPPWDDLRERRVLRGIERRLQERSGRRQGRWILLAIAAAIPLLLGITALVLCYFTGFDLHSQRATVGAPGSVQPTAVASQPATGIDGGFDALTRVLDDGSLLELSPAARVRVRSETTTKVEVAQDAGRVRYQVSPTPGRAFVVSAEGVQVRVTGTIFIVNVEAGKVSVKVERGRVRVSSSSGEVELGVGDELSTSAEDAAVADRPAEPSRAPDGAPSSHAGAREPASMPPASALLDRADAERRSGDLSSAAATLHELVTRYPLDRRAALAWFTLGKVERARDHAGAGAKAFHKSFALAPEGPLGEDALAEEAAAWAAANDGAQARIVAAQYLHRFPNGTHGTRMSRLLE